MKNVYNVLTALCICFMTFGTQSIYAQCTCGDGNPATPIKYYATLDTTNTASSTLSFPLFNPTIGTLSCLYFDDTISGITTTNVWNLASIKTDYEFLLLVSNAINGPGGLNVVQPFTKIYGPDSLNAMGNSPGDSIVYGPDNFFTNATQHTQIMNVAPYIGAAGNVSLTYSINGGLSTIQGGLNFGQKIVTNYWGSFGLTYYWCPNVPLANSFTYFNAAKNNNNILLNWQVQNELAGITYQIQYSTNGTQFTPIATQVADSNAIGNLANYQFTYPVPGSNNGTLYFRIQRNSPDGKSAYSSIQKVNLNSSNGIAANLQTYPNPVKTYTMLEFDQSLTGDYSVELVNTAGQVIQKNRISLSGTNQARLDLNSHPTSGIYFLRVINNNNNENYTTKLIIE